MSKFQRFYDLNKRIWISIAVFSILAFLLIFSSNPIISIVICLFTALIAAIGVWEYANLAKSKGFVLSKYFMIAIAICVVVSFFIVHRTNRFHGLPIFIFACGLVLFFLSHFKRPENGLIKVAAEFFSIAYVAFPLSFILGILYPMSSQVKVGEQGIRWVIYLILVTKMTDIGGYFIGKLFGKTPLAPILSPQKTVEGAGAGLLCAIFTSLAFSYFHLVNIPLFSALWMGTLIGILGQVGDLAESLLKRDAFVKDSNVLPGVGGILDMIDSLIFTAPALYFFLK
ncbi:MAG: phosphatidate cytidylyltransferase [Chlamydiae bacterium]|nr:phosphatidate cytidylyltransferase [Chlamydiota bacterium]